MGGAHGPYSVSGENDNGHPVEFTMDLDRITFVSPDPEFENLEMSKAIPWQAMARYSESIDTITITVVPNLAEPAKRRVIELVGDERAFSVAFKVLLVILHFVLIKSRNAK